MQTHISHIQVHCFGLWFLCVVSLDCFEEGRCVCWFVDQEESLLVIALQGDATDTHFDGLDVGSVDAVKGKLDDEDYKIFCMKEHNYVCKIFGTAGGLITVDEREHWRVWTKDGHEQSSSFKYTDPFYLHFRYHLLSLLTSERLKSSSTDSSSASAVDAETKVSTILNSNKQ